MILGAMAGVAVALCGALAQGRHRSAVAGAALPGIAVAVALQFPVGVGEALVGTGFAVGTMAAWVGVIPAPARVQLTNAVVSGLALGLSLAVARPAAAWQVLLGPIVLSTAVTGVELLGSRGNPYGEWGSLAHSQTRRRWALEVARFGPYAVTWVLVWVSSGFGYGVALSSWSGIAVALAGVVALCALSVRAGRSLPRSHEGHEVRVTGLIEHEPDLFAVCVPEFLRGGLTGERFETFERRSRQSLTQLLLRTAEAGTTIDAPGPTLVVWAEGAGLVSAGGYAEALEGARDAARRAHCTLVASWAILDPLDGLMSNIATVIDPEGDVVSTTAKRHPVPGLEASKTRRDASYEPVVPTAVGRLGVSICFDADHADTWRRLAGADLDVVAIPASDWPTIGTLHADMARLRARSIGVSMIRVARQGISQLIDADGRLAGEVDHRADDRPDLAGTLRGIAR